MPRYLTSLAIAFAMFSACPSHAQNLLKAEEILRVLPGVWAMEVAIPPDTAVKLQCKDLAMRITFETGPDGQQVYVARPLDGITDEAGADGAARSDVKIGLGGYSILLQYWNEDRLDDKGKPVRWHLVMTDRNTFYWHRDDWPGDTSTAASHRCPDPDIVG